MHAHDADDKSDEPIPDVHDAYAAIRRGNFRRYWTGNLLSIIGMQMQSVTVVWEVYKRTNDPFSVGLVGLVLVVPVLSLALVGGHVADRFDRKRVLASRCRSTWRLRWGWRPCRSSSGTSRGCTAACF